MINLMSRFLYSLIAFTVLACSEKPVPSTPLSDAATPAMSSSDFTVYKSPTCGCCADWIAHVNDAGFTTQTVHPDDLNTVKQSLNIPRESQSCHTAVTKEGYVFEGHIPAHVIQRFLAERPANAIGLAVPGMPVGSPGMEMGDRFDAYDVWLLRKDGKREVFTHIASPRGELK